MSSMGSMTEENWKAFEYEVKMFVDIRAKREVGNADQTVQNALVESSLLHIRILADALLNKGEHPDDITIDKLIPPGTRSPQTDAALGKVKGSYGDRATRNAPCWAINKMLAHLTAERGASYDYGWLFRAMEPVLEEALSFVASEASRPVLARYIAAFRGRSAP